MVHQEQRRSNRAEVEVAQARPAQSFARPEDGRGEHDPVHVMSQTGPGIRGRNGAAARAHQEYRKSREPRSEVGNDLFDIGCMRCAKAKFVLHSRGVIRGGVHYRSDNARLREQAARTHQEIPPVQMLPLFFLRKIDPASAPGKQHGHRQRVTRGGNGKEVGLGDAGTGRQCHDFFGGGCVARDNQGE